MPPSANASPTLARLMATPMSMAQVQKFVGKDVPVIEYAKFAKLKTLPSACIYLFLTSENYGHFCAVLRKGDTVELFDSYGIKPEAEHHFVQLGLLEHLHERDDFILDLCKKNKWNVVHNHTQLQSWNPKVATCGRHASERVHKQDLTIDQYVEWIQSVCKTAKVSPDVLVSYLVQ